MQFVGTPPADRTVLRLVGSGGMGVVFEARDERLDRRVALKVLHPHLMIQEETRGRLLKEARLAARIEHENVVRIYNVHELDGGLCLEMQYVDGVSLSHLITDIPMSPPRAVDLLHQVLDALAACHAQNVIHADLKPGNLLITQEGRVLLADFGISRAAYADGEGPSSTLTRSGVMWGTPQYCPPEAWTGGLPDTSWDLYALGVLVYEALCGGLPYSGETPAMLMREKLEGKRIPIAEKCADLSAELADLIDALSSDDAAARPANAVAALESLRNTPEYRSSMAETSPLRHSESTTFGIPVPLQTGTAIPYMTAGQGPRPGTLYLSLALAGLLLLTAMVYAMGYYSRRPPVPETVPPVAAVGNVREVLDLSVGLRNALFSYDDGLRGRELWLADSRGYLGMVSDINPDKASSNPRGFIWGDSDACLFVATTEEQGTEPWLFEFKPPQVRLLREIVPGPMHGNPEPLTSWRHTYYFSASTLDRGDGVWVSDRSSERTGMLHDVFPTASVLNNRNSPRFLDGEGIYTVRSEPKSQDLVYYRFSDGHLTRLCAASANVRDLVKLGDRIIFTMPQSQFGMELWATDTTAGEAQLLKDIWPGSESGDPMEFYCWNGAVYFRAITHEHGFELWKSDGTPSGTVLVSDLNPGVNYGSPTNFVGTPGRLFFRAAHEMYGMELWSTTGEPGSEATIYDLNPGRLPSTPYSLALIGDFLCFSADDGIHGEELWALDTSNEKNKPFLVSDIRPGADSSEPHNLKAFAGNSGIFVYKTGQGDALMRVLVDGRNIELKPYAPLTR